MKVRLLSKGFYSDEGIIAEIKFPAEVIAKLSEIGDHIVSVPGSEIGRLAGNSYCTDEAEFSFINPTSWNGRTEVMWELVDDNPFSQWNALKATREAGAMPARF